MDWRRNSATAERRSALQREHGSVGEKPRIGFVAQAQDESVGGQQKRPEQQRTFLPRPKHGKLIRTGKIAVAVVKDVGDREIILEGADDEDDRSQKNSAEGCDAGAPGRFADAL